MVYGDDFYAGHAALTKNTYGKGTACYVAADAEEAFYDDFIAALMKEKGIKAPVTGAIPVGLEVTTRETDTLRYYFYQNFSAHPVKLPLPEGAFETVYGDAEAELRIFLKERFSGVIFFSKTASSITRRRHSHHFLKSPPERQRTGIANFGGNGLDVQIGIPDKFAGFFNPEPLQIFAEGHIQMLLKVGTEIRRGHGKGLCGRSDA